MQRTNDSLLTTLVEYIKNNDTKAFIHLFNKLDEMKDLFRFNIYQLHEGMTLYQHALKHRSKPIFQFLLENKFSEYNYTDPNPSKTVRYLVDHLAMNKGVNQADFNYWYMLVTQHSNLICDIKEQSWSKLTLLQHACLHDTTVVDKLIADGFTLNPINFDDAGNLETPCQKSLDILLHMYPDFIGAPLPEIVRRNIAYLAINTRNLELLQNMLIHPITKKVNASFLLDYAVKKDFPAAVDKLLAQGALPFKALRRAISLGKTRLAEQLLFHGGGMFQDLDPFLMRAPVSANYCYVEGLKIGGKPVTKKTIGFDRAFFSIAEMMEHKQQQDSLHIYSHQNPLPFHSLKACFDDLKEQPNMLDNTVFFSALDAFENADKVISLQTQLKKMLLNNRFNRAFLQNLHVNSLEQLLGNVGDNLQKQILGINPEQQFALAAVHDRIDELISFKNFSENIQKTMIQNDKSLETAVKLLLCVDTSYLTGFAMNSFISCCCTCNINSGCCCAPLCCCCSCASTYSHLAPMEYLGIPGFVGANFTVMLLAGLIIYYAKFGSLPHCDDYIDRHDESHTLARRDKKIADTLDVLIRLLGSEYLPEHVNAAVLSLANPKVTFATLLKSLSTLINYYKIIEIPRIKNDKTLTPFKQFNSSLFFWNESQRKKNRNNKLPTQLAMNDAVDLQNHFGFELFEVVEPPKQLAMHDANDEENPYQNDNNIESIPLLRH